MNNMTGITVARLTLADLKKGDHARVIGYHDRQSSYAQRLRTLGLIPGTRLLVKRFAPLGDPRRDTFSWVTTNTAAVRSALSDFGAS